MQKYVLIAILVVAVVVYLYIVYRKQGKAAVLATIREAIYKLMLTAEKKFGKEAGEQKLSFVLTALYDYIAPDIVRKFISDEDLKSYIQKLYDEYYVKAKDYLDDGKINGSATE
ncbi:MAG: hypothetical protein QME45_04415 [Clostridiales bacterium]|nr:hypothetical protein [Clostridiales bacterium]